MQRMVIVGVLVGSVGSALAATGQRDAQSPPRFEVASIKRNTSGDFRRGIGPGPGGRFTATNVPLRDLVAFAFGVPNNRATLQIVGGPEWMERERFDVEAVATGGVIPSGQAGPMVRALLEERFHLRAHHETREIAVFQLVRNGAAPGLRLRASAIDCAARRAARAAGAAPPPPPSGPPQDPTTIRPICGLRLSPGRFAGDGVTMSQLADGLAPFVGRVVVDRTALTGYFDIDLEWTVEQQQPDPPPPASVGADTPGVFTAIREQLELRLSDGRAPVDVVVIDTVDRLIEN